MSFSLDRKSTNIYRLKFHVTSELERKTVQKKTASWDGFFLILMRLFQY